MSEFDIDSAHRVPTRNQNGCGRATGRPFLTMCKFTQCIARDGVLAKRKETHRLLPESFASWRIVSSASRFTPKASGIAT